MTCAGWACSCRLCFLDEEITSVKVGHVCRYAFRVIVSFFALLIGVELTSNKMHVLSVLNFLVSVACCLVGWGSSKVIPYEGPVLIISATL